MDEQHTPYGVNASPADRVRGPMGSIPQPKSWYRRTWVVALAAGLAGVAAGAAAGAGDVTATPEYAAVAAEQDKVEEAAATLEDELATVEDELAAAEQALADKQAELEEVAGDLPAREAAVTKAEKELAAHEAVVTKAGKTVARREKAVAKREKAVGIVEKEIERNTIPGDGIFEVGVDVKAGTYKTAGTDGCYYAILASTDTSDIVDNNNVDGPAVVTLSTGQYLELSRCAEWVLQR